MFTLNGGAVVWQSTKQSCVADSTMEVEYVAACEATKEVVWLRKFFYKPISCYKHVNAHHTSHFIVIIVVLWQIPKSLEATNMEST